MKAEAVKSKAKKPLAAKETRPKASPKPVVQEHAAAHKVAPSVRKPKSRELKKLQDRIKAKKRHWFRGRFGKKSIRRLSIEKWQKWRRPRGTDISRNKEDGLVVESGYRTANETRFVHPSGFREQRVFSVSDFPKETNVAIRIGRTVGKKKRGVIAQRARELGFKILN